MHNAKQTITIGPICASALSCIASFFLLQSLACSLCQDFNLLSNRGVGKFAFMTLVILHLIGLCMLMPSSFLKTFISTNTSFFRTRSWLKDFFVFFSLFALLHILFLLTGVATGYAVFNPTLSLSYTKLTSSLVIGFIATFLLAWSEEMIFRGTLYRYLSLNMPPFPSIIITSILFSLAHNLTAPWQLLTTDYQLGLGLFLLGLLLNLIFVITNKLYCSMGAHAGLVFIKVCLRRAPIITLLPLNNLPWWLAIDLRQSFFVHLIFILCSIALCIRYKKSIFTSHSIERNVRQ